MDGLLSLRWNNHSSSFLKQLSFLHEKDRYSDLTLVCGGQFYRVHQLVVSCCSEYLRTILENTPCRHPAIVLQDMLPRHLEALLSYMYLGQVSVTQDDLAALIKAAECLAIKDLTVLDEVQTSKHETSTHSDHTQDEDLPNPKRLRQDRRCSSPPLPASAVQREDSMAENNNRKRSRGSSPQSAVTFPPQQQNLMAEKPVIKLEVEEKEKQEEEEEEVKCEGDKSVDVRDQDVDLLCQEDDIDTENQTVFRTFTHDISGSDGSGSSHVSPHFLPHTLSFEEVMSQALPGTSAIDKDTGQVWEGSQGTDEVTQPYPLETYTTQENLHFVHHSTSLHHRGLRTTRWSRQPHYPGQDMTTSWQHTTSKAPSGKDVAQLDRRCCHICGYRGQDVSQLKKHLRIHTGEKPYKCHMCTYSAAQSSNLRVHIKKHHPMEWQKSEGKRDLQHTPFIIQ